MEIKHVNRKIGEARKHESVLVRTALDTSPILGDSWVTPRGRHGQPGDMGRHRVGPHGGAGNRSERWAAGPCSEHQRWRAREGPSSESARNGMQWLCCLFLLQNHRGCWCKPGSPTVTRPPPTSWPLLTGHATQSSLLGLEGRVRGWVGLPSRATCEVWWLGSRSQGHSAQKKEMGDGGPIGLSHGCEEQTPCGQSDTMQGALPRTSQSTGPLQAFK